MRITQNMLVGNFLVNLNKNFREMDKIQNQLSSGKRINKPSDDPVRVINSLRLRTGLTETERYLTNVSDAMAWLSSTDTALGNAGDLLQRARELVVSGASDTLSQQSRDAVAKEIHQLREQLIQVANTSHDGRFIFGGFQTVNAPFTAAGVYTGDNGSINYEIGINISIPVNVAGDSVFINAQDAFQLLSDIEADLAVGDTDSLANVRLGDVDTVIDNILSIRAEVGARYNRLELTKSRLDDANINLSGLLAKNEDIDVADTITQLKMQESTYRTALSAGARIIQPSLLDFLR